MTSPPILKRTALVAVVSSSRGMAPPILRRASDRPWLIAADIDQSNRF